MKQRVGSPRRNVRRLLESYGKSENRNDEDIRSGEKLEGDRRTESRRLKAKEEPGRVPEADSEAKQQPAPER